MYCKSVIVRSLKSKITHLLPCAAKRNYTTQEGRMCYLRRSFTVSLSKIKHHNRLGC